MNVNKELIRSIGLGFADAMLACSPGFLAGITVDAYVKKYNMFSKHAKYITPFVTASIATPVIFLGKKRIDYLGSLETSVEILQNVCKEYKKKVEELQGEEA